ARVIAERARFNQHALSVPAIEDEIETIVETLKAETVAAFADGLLARDRRSGGKSAFLAADRIVSEKWRDKESRWGAVNAKSVFSALSEWSQRNFGCSFGVSTVVRSMRAEEVVPELASVLSALEFGIPFEQAGSANTKRQDRKSTRLN